MVEDMIKLYKKYGFDQEEFNHKQLEFRLKLLKEEFHETLDAAKNKDSEELVDGLIDICVIAIGTLNLAGVDTQKAWDAVYRSNNSKTRGVKPGRSGGMDVFKEEGKFIPVNHEKNHGVLDELWQTSKTN